MQQDISKFNLAEIYQAVSAKTDLTVKMVERSYSVDADAAKSIVAVEIENLMARLEKYWNDPTNHKTGSPTLTTAQAINIFTEVLQAGLSFSELADHVYVSRMKGSGSAVTYKTTVYGDLFLAQKAGAITHWSEPVLVHNDEPFLIVNSPEGYHVAEHKISFDGRPPFKIRDLKVGYAYISFPSGKRELSWISGNRLRENMAKSSKPGNYNDETFVQTKILRHALKKIRKTPFSAQRPGDEDFTTKDPPPSTTY